MWRAAGRTGDSSGSRGGILASVHPQLARRCPQRLDQLRHHKSAPLLAPDSSRNRQDVPDLEMRQMQCQSAGDADDELGAVVAEIEPAQLRVD
jgi:hypothetical protein